VAHGLTGLHEFFLQVEDAFADHETGFQLQFIKRFDQIVVGPGRHRMQPFSAILGGWEKGEPVKPRAKTGDGKKDFLAAPRSAAPPKAFRSR
jgi:hypothetical protein